MTEKSGLFTAERMLVLLIRATSAVLLFALVPVFMPFRWMEEIHQWAGLGVLSDTPTVHYLTRSLSALYAFWGAIFLFVSFDIRRHRRLIIFCGLATIVFGVGMLILDAAVRMPLFWTLVEGPFTVLLGGILIAFARAMRPGDPAKPKRRGLLMPVRIW